MPQFIDIPKFLIEQIDRPLPKSPTHYILAEIVNKDYSIKRVTIYFNPDDYWQGPKFMPGENNFKTVGMMIIDNLVFIVLDEAALECFTYIVEVATNEVVFRGRRFGVSKAKVPYNQRKA
jgi:hypothetical protein